MDWIRQKECDSQSFARRGSSTTQWLLRSAGLSPRTPLTPFLTQIPLAFQVVIVVARRRPPSKSETLDDVRDGGKARSVPTPSRREVAGHSGTRLAGV